MKDESLKLCPSSLKLHVRLIAIVRVFNTVIVDVTVIRFFGHGNGPSGSSVGGNVFDK